MVKNDTHGLPGFAPVKSVLLLMALMLFGMAGCAKQVSVPPVTPVATGDQLQGKFIWHDLFTADMAVAIEFYGPLFGWTFTQFDVEHAGVKTIMQNGQPIGNIVSREAKTRNSKWLAYLSVDDVDSAVERVTQNGGSIHVTPKDFPDRGRFAVIHDPQMASVAILTSSSGDPADKPFSSNTWMGCELWTSDLDGAVQFYKVLAGYTASTRKVLDKRTYTLLSSHGRARAGVVSAPWEDFKPEWIPYVAVNDIQSVLTKVRALGGRVLVAPDMTVKEGRNAIIVDPVGAVFGVQQLR